MEDHAVSDDAARSEERRGGDEALAGPQPVLFFAPDKIRKRRSEWGPAELEARFAAGLAAFIQGSPWLTLVHHQGPQALLDAYAQILEGRARPEDGHIIRPA